MREYKDKGGRAWIPGQAGEWHHDGLMVFALPMSMVPVGRMQWVWKSAPCVSTDNRYRGYFSTEYSAMDAAGKEGEGT